MNKKIAIIAGAGPAGLTAAYELLQRTDIIPIIFEQSGDIGGISKTVNYKGNRIDIGGHRFFSKSDRVMRWWLQRMPVEDGAEGFAIHYQNKTTQVPTSKVSQDQPDSDKVMLVRNRLSRIYFLKKFFSYPVSLSVETIKGLGLWRTLKIGFSYMGARLSPINEEKSLEDFFINRFGKELYLTFFKDYTEKVWGQKCHEISADWGAQRIKGLSMTKALLHAARQITSSKKDNSIDQKGTETSLIERFLYPKYGPGQMWETVASEIQTLGGQLHMHTQVCGIILQDSQVRALRLKNMQTGEEYEMACDYFFSTMPVRELIAHIHPAPPEAVQQTAAGLLYRDFITVGLLMKKLKVREDDQRPASAQNLIKDNWIYIQERDVQVGRLQIFNNWSPHMVANPEHVWIGMEYFCNEGDLLWTMSDEDLKTLGIKELSHIGIIEAADVIDATVLRMEKAYPAYFGSYNDFDKVRAYTDSIENMYLIGRNGMHKYNNSDHSMLTAMTAVDNIVAGISTKENIWKINTEMDYHEEK